MSYKSFPLWAAVKLEIIQPLWNASESLERYRFSNNPKWFTKFISSCVTAWTHIKPQVDEPKTKTDKEIVKKLDSCVKGITSELKNDQDFWITAFDYLCRTYKKVGLTDIKRTGDDVDDENAIVEGLLS